MRRALRRLSRLGRSARSRTSAVCQKVHAGLHVSCKMAHIHTQGARGALPRGCVGAQLRGSARGGASGVSQKGQKMCIDGESEPQNCRASVGAHHGQSSALRGRPLRSVKAGVGPRRGPQLGAILRRRKWQSRASLTRASAAPLLHPTRGKRVVPGCWVRRAAARGQRRAGRGTPNMEEERARPSGPSRAACIRHWQSTRESSRARWPREKLAPWRAAARPPLRARSGCSGAYGARHKWRQGAMAQLRQRRVEHPARHCAARRQGQAFVQPQTLAWRSCGHRSIDNARPPGPFACASPRRQEDEKAAAAAALGRGATFFFCRQHAQPCLAPRGSARLPCLWV